MIFKINNFKNIYLVNEEKITPITRTTIPIPNLVRILFSVLGI